MARLDVVLDGRTSALIAAARATQAAEHLPKESARSLVALSRGTRLYLEATQPTLARRCLEEIGLLLAGVDDPDISKAFGDLVSNIQKELLRPVKAPPITRPTPTP